MDTFVDSSWYFLRYCDPKSDKLPFDKKSVDYWMPIDVYIGGKEHATMHLIYFRYFTKFLRDLGLVSVDEPNTHLFNQGMLHKNGFVMSKSRGNVVTPEEISEKYGIDTARFFMMFVASPDKDMEWDDKGVEGSYRFLLKTYSLLDKKQGKMDNKVQSKMHRTIKSVTDNIINFKYNQALIDYMDYVNYLHKRETVPKECVESLAILISPFCPHLGEEMWEKIGGKGFISSTKWPKYDESKIDKAAEAEEKILEKTIYDIKSVMKIIKKEKAEKITIIISEKWKYALFKKVKKIVEKTRNIGEIIKEVIDEDHKKDISQIVPKLIKDPSRIPAEILNQKSELEALESSKEGISSEFKCDVDIIIAEKSEDPKAKQAMPHKPSIIIE
jgi:leucyl-tRNA synthetase